MTDVNPSPLRLNIRAKILLLFLTLALISLTIIGFFAFSAINSIGIFAQNSSQALGEEAISNSTVALQTMGEEYLLRVASDQAEVTDVLFKDTDSEMEILAANAAFLQNNAPSVPVSPSFFRTAGPQDPRDGTLLFFASTATTGVNSQESKTLAGLDDSLNAVYHIDSDMTSIYVATDSGMMRMYPWNGAIPENFDPRTRDWFVNAKKTNLTTWSDIPYVDVTGNGLVMTCSKAVYNPKFGYWVVSSDVSTTTINKDFLHQTLGGSGYAVLINQDGTIISRPGLTSGTLKWNEPFASENAFSNPEEGIKEIAHNMTAGKTGIERVWFGNEEFYVAYAPVKSMNWSLAISLPVSQVSVPVQQFEGHLTRATESTRTQIVDKTNQFRIVFAILFTVIFIAVLYLSVLLARIITKPVETLKVGVRALGEGNLDYRVSIQTGDEFEDLGHSFNTMAGDLKKNIEELRRTTIEKERYANEMEIAKNIQESFLPESTPRIFGFDIAAVNIPAMEVGGDFYDFIPMNHDQYTFVIADVSGKGVSAALFMAMSRTLIHAGLEGKDTISAGLMAANRLITRDTKTGMFVTTFAALLDPHRMTLSCINAGHNPPLVIRGDTKESFFLSKQGTAIGLLEDMHIEEEVIDLRPGDYVIFYTDGVTEAFSDQFEAFGDDRLINAAMHCNGRLAQEVISGIISRIKEFTGAAPQSDDITLIILRVLPVRVQGRGNL